MLAFAFATARVTLCAGLQVLDLAHTLLRSDLPAAAPPWSQLRVLRLRDTQLRGAIPPWVVQLPALEVLDIGLNLFSGALPAFPTAPAVMSLTAIAVDRAGLSGPLPDGWNAPRLEVMELSFNNFSGPLFSSTLCARAPSLRRLVAPGNTLSGQWGFLLETCANVRSRVAVLCRYFTCLSPRSTSLPRAVLVWLLGCVSDCSLSLRFLL